MPAWTLPAVVREGDAITERTLSGADLAGKPYVLFFYPRDATPGCTVEVCGFRDLYPEFRKLGIEVLGVSRDTIGAHKKFITNQELPYPLLSDKQQVLIDGWLLLIAKTMYGKPVTGVSRDTYFVDAKGKVSRIFRKVTPLGHAQEVLDFARSQIS